MNINKNDMAARVTDPQHEDWSETGVAWGVVGDSVQENTTGEHSERRFNAAKKNGCAVFLIVLCAVLALTGPAVAQQPSAEMPGMGPSPTLPPPNQTSTGSTRCTLIAQAQCGLPHRMGSIALILRSVLLPSTPSEMVLPATQYGPGSRSEPQAAADQLH